MMVVKPGHDDDDDGVQEVNPLRGVVLCCTSLPQEIRSKVEEVVKPMGAIHKPDLTTDVTHLLVGKIDTPKYRYVAAERPDISVLHPSWIEAAREAWMSGGTVDVEALTAAHRLPTLHDLQICVTGFTGQDERNLIMSHVQRNGAVYHGDLTRAVTHLIAAVPEGKKYDAAKAWGEVKIVSLKWLEDCLRRGMVLNEELYDPMLPAQKQGRNAFRESVARSSTSVKRTRDAAGGDGGEDGAKRKLRRTVSSRLHEQSQDMWTDLSGMEMKKEEPKRDQWKDESSDVADRALVKAEPAASELDQSSTISMKEDPGHRSDGPTNDAKPSQAPEALFAGRHILLHGFDNERAARLRSFLEPNGAHIANTSRDLDDASATDPLFQARYLLVPHALPSAPKATITAAARGSTATHQPIYPLPDVPAGTQTVTEWWVERCIHSKRLLDPTTDALSRPFWHFPGSGSTGDLKGRSPKSVAASSNPQSIRIEGFEAVNISTTGFSGVDVRQIAGAVRLLGGSYLETLSKETSVIVCGSSEDVGMAGAGSTGTAAAINKGKAFYAVRHGIPVVSPGWLWACLEKGRVVAFEPFKLQLPDVYPDALRGDAAASSGSGDVAAGAGDAGSSHNGDGKVRDESRRNGSSSHSNRLSSSRKKTTTSSLSLQASKPDTSFARDENTSDRAQTGSSALKLDIAETKQEPTAVKPHDCKKIQSGPSTSKTKPSPFVHEDDDEDEDDTPLVNEDSLPPPSDLSQDLAPRRQSQPLAEVSPNLSPRKAGIASARDEGAVKQSSGTDDLKSNVAHISPPSVDTTAHPPQSKPQASTLRNNASNLAADVRSLLDHATSASSRPTSARTASSADSSSSHNRQSAAAAEASSTSHLLARKKRPLGRNISGNGLSNLSTSTSLNAGVDARQQAESTSTFAPLLPPMMLGTQISYASPDAELHRAEMGRKMGLKFSDDEGDDHDGGAGGGDGAADGDPGNTNGTEGNDLQRDASSRLLDTQKPKSSGLKREKLQRLGRVKDSEVLSAAGSKGGATAAGGVASRVRARVGRGR